MDAIWTYGSPLLYYRIMLARMHAVRPASASVPQTQRCTCDVREAARETERETQHVRNMQVRMEGGGERESDREATRVRETCNMQVTKEE